ncbi:hypothetical protein CYMTET_44231, partial [Cymbomonas tetramitiformis]
MVKVQEFHAADLFRCFTTSGQGTFPLIVDLRSNKDYKRGHVHQSYNVALSKNGKVIADYSKANWKPAWSKGLWWGKDVIVYGAAKVPDSDPVLAFLLAEDKARSISIMQDGFGLFAKLYPFLSTASTRGAPRNFPSEIMHDFIYLGTLEHAEDVGLLKDMGIKRVLTIHNIPENLELPKSFKHLRMTLADVEGENISQYFEESFSFLEKARRKGDAVLVHCGAGVSRSATLCIAYLIQKEGLNDK